jgi:hypothetical protein
MRIARLVFIFLAGCSADTAFLVAPPPAAEAEPEVEVEVELEGAGWQLRDSTPYPRTGHVAIYDEAADRMLIFGGGANDVWTLPLSGTNANRWAQLETTGQKPPLHPYGSSMFADSAIYDPETQRMIVVAGTRPSTSAPVEKVNIWQLTLSGTPTWSELVGQGPSPGSEIQSGRAVYDPAGRRMIILGGALQSSGVWALSLDGDPTWSRLANSPETRGGAFYTEHSLVLDAQENRLILFGGHPRLKELWSLSLSTGRWTLLDDGNHWTGSYGVTTLFDTAKRRILVSGGDQGRELAGFELDTGIWSSVPAERRIGAAAIIDRPRNRALFFGGSNSGIYQDNTTTALDLETMSWSVFLPPTKTLDLLIGERQLVYDSVKGSVIAYGGHSESATSEHRLGTEDMWTVTDAGETPRLALSPGIYDPLGKAIVAFGSHHYTLPIQTWTLSSEPGAVWTEVDAGDSIPPERIRGAAIYDEVGKRLLSYGGFRHGNPHAIFLGDLWALSLDGTPIWSSLSPVNSGPGPRAAAAAVYDAKRRRMILIGGENEMGTPETEVWALSLTDLKWQHLSVRGTAPSALENPSAIYDVEREKIVLAEQPETGLRLYALQLDENEVTWREYCWNTITPAPTRGFPGTSGGLLAFPGGVFYTTSGGAFTFDLDTPLCD